MNSRHGGYVGNERGAFDRPQSHIPPIDGMEHLGLGSDVAGDGKIAVIHRSISQRHMNKERASHILFAYVVTTESEGGRMDLAQCVG